MNSIDLYILFLSLENFYIYLYIGPQKYICVIYFITTCAIQGFVYAIGGNNGAASLETCERYDPHLNKWTLVESMNKRRAGAGVAELNGQLYVVG